jgi:probable F420-dependent oxidoreductase
MQIGVVFPQLDIGADRAAVKASAQGVAELGFAHILAYDHVLGADPAVHSDWSGTYSAVDTFHEPLVLFGFLAGIVDLELVTGIIILPQRQTALVAKQAAEVDILSGGRLRFGIGLGWNAVEYEALGMDFSTRGRRIEEQVDLLRRLWTEPSLTYEGEDHRITGAGIAPLPLQRPIPVWMGATSSTNALRRVGRLADGWLAMGQPGPQLTQAADVIRTAAAEAGRNPADLGIEGRINVGDGDLIRVAAELSGWRELGATHVSFNTMRAGLDTLEDHLNALRAALDIARA